MNLTYLILVIIYRSHSTMEDFRNLILHRDAGYLLYPKLLPIAKA